MRRVAPEQLQLESARSEPPVQQAAGPRTSRRRSAADLLQTPGALLTRSHLRELGLERRAIDAVFRRVPVVALPGYSRPMIPAAGYLELVEQHTYSGDTVRPCGQGMNRNA